MNNLLLLGAAGGTACCASHPHLAAAGVFAAGILVGFVGAKIFGRRGKCACKNAKSGAAKAPSKRENRPAPEPRMPIPAGSVEIYVGNLSYDLDEAGLRKLFEEFGTVSSVRVVTNRFNDKSKGFGFVVMPNRSEAEKAIAALNDKDIQGRPMRVNEARNTVKEQA